jgi:predicted nucleic acid-binding protein
MKVIVDTAIWSLALRNSQRREVSACLEVEFLKALVEEGRVVLLGVVRQETLSGIRHPKQYETLKTYLRAFPNLVLDTEDYELAAAYFNQYRRQGVQGSHTDFLICAVASRRQFSILTTDKDFEGFSQYIPVSLITPQ